MTYSGKVTADNCIGMKINPKPAISQVTWFNVQWSDCPVEVEEEVKLLWEEQQLGNDHCFYAWASDATTCINDELEEVRCGDRYPIIDAYLRSKGVTVCYIHWWW